MLLQCISFQRRAPSLIPTIPRPHKSFIFLCASPPPHQVIYIPSSQQLFSSEKCQNALYTAPSTAVRLSFSGVLPQIILPPLLHRYALSRQPCTIMHAHFQAIFRATVARGIRAEITSKIERGREEEYIYIVVEIKSLTSCSSFLYSLIVRM